MNPNEIEIQEDEMLMMKRAAVLFLEYSKRLQFSIDQIAFMKELFHINRSPNENDAGIEFSEEQRVGLYELLKDGSLNELSVCYEAIHEQFIYIRYEPGTIHNELVSSLDRISEVKGKLAFIQILGDLPVSQYISLSYSAVSGLVRAFKDIEHDIKRVQETLRNAGDSIISSIQSDTGDKPNQPPASHTIP